MTSKLDVIKAWRAVPPGDLEGALAYLSDDFQNVDENGNVLMNKEAYRGMGLVLRASLPDFEYMHSVLREEDAFVIMTGHFEGTFVNDLDMSAMGAGVIPASGKKIVWSETDVKMTVAGGKIARMEPYNDSGGMGAFLAPLMP